MALWPRFQDWMSRTFGVARTAVPREPVSIKPIGVVRNKVAAPRPDGWESVVSDIIIKEEMEPMLEGIDGYTHILVIFAFDRVPESAQRERVRLRGDSSIPEQGVLATRSQLRPSPLGVSVVRLLRRRRTILRVQGLDAIDQTPVLDIKPYFPNYDAVPDAGVPAWASGSPQT